MQHDCNTAMQCKLGITTMHPRLDNREIKVAELLELSSFKVILIIRNVGSAMLFRKGRSVGKYLPLGNNISHI